MAGQLVSLGGRLDVAGGEVGQFSPVCPLDKCLLSPGTCLPLPAINFGFVCLSACLSVCPSVCLLVSASVFLC